MQDASSVIILVRSIFQMFSTDIEHTNAMPKNPSAPRLSTNLERQSYLGHNREPRHRKTK